MRCVKLFAMFPPVASKVQRLHTAIGSKLSGKEDYEALNFRLVFFMA